MTAHTGAPLPRREDIRLLTGAGRYVDDVHLDGMTWSCIAPVLRPRTRRATARARPSCGVAACIAHDGEPGGSDPGA
jgi:CO/xanthine dehydrogenase Mo-binding subunit